MRARPHSHIVELGWLSLGHLLRAQQGGACRVGNGSASEVYTRPDFVFVPGGRHNRYRKPGLSRTGQCGRSTGRMTGGVKGSSLFRILCGIFLLGLPALVFPSPVLPAELVSLSGLPDREARAE